MFDLAKRLGRFGFFGYWLLAVVVVAVISYPAAVLSRDMSGTQNIELLRLILTAMLGYLMVLPVSVRRLHDIGWSGWWVLLLFVPFVFAALFLALLFWPGTKEANRFGPPPKVRRSA